MKNNWTLNHKTEKQNSGKPINRKISRSQMALINPIKICWVLVSVRVALEALFTKGKIFNNNNIIIMVIDIMIQKVITVILAIIIIIMMIVMKVVIEVTFCSFKFF